MAAKLSEATKALENAIQVYVNAVQETDGDSIAVVTGWTTIITALDTKDGGNICIVPSRPGQTLTTTLGHLVYATRRTERGI